MTAAELLRRAHSISMVRSSRTLPVGQIWEWVGFAVLATDVIFVGLGAGGGEVFQPGGRARGWDFRASGGKDVRKRKFWADFGEMGWLAGFSGGWRENQATGGRFGSGGVPGKKPKRPTGP